MLLTKFAVGALGEQNVGALATNVICPFVSSFTRHLTERGALTDFSKAVAADTTVLRQVSLLVAVAADDMWTSFTTSEFSTAVSAPVSTVALRASLLLVIVLGASNLLFTAVFAHSAFFGEVLIATWRYCVSDQMLR